MKRKERRDKHGILKSQDRTDRRDAAIILYNRNFSVNQIAEWLSVHPSTIRRWWREGWAV